MATKQSAAIIGKAGERAYLDGHSGLVPCDVLEVLEDGRIKVKMRADLGVKSWHGKNEYGNWTSEEIFTPSMVVPRRAIKLPAKGNFHATILPYRWEKGKIHEEQAPAPA